MHRRLLKVRKHLGLTQQQIASILGIGQNAYSMIENGRIQLTERNRSILAERLYVNPVFLTEGRGGMMLMAPTHEPLSPAMLANTPMGQLERCGDGVPYYTKRLTGTMAKGTLYEEPQYFIDFEPFNDCTFYRQVFGDSMSPRYNAGDIVACKVVLNKGTILYGESYLCLISIDGDSYETIKILRRHAVQGMVTLMPLNPAFDQTDLPMDAICDLYLIRGKIEQTV